MNNAFSQRDSFKKLDITIAHNGIHVVEKILAKKSDYFVPFENIACKPYHNRVFRQWAIIITMICGVFSVLGIWVQTTNESTGSLVSNIIELIFIFFLPLLILWLTRKDFAGLMGEDGSLAVRTNKPSKKAVQEFLQVLYQTRTSYLRETYFEKEISSAPREEMRNLIWLRQQEVISLEEFENQKQKVELHFSTLTEKAKEDVIIYYQGDKESIVATARYLADKGGVIKGQLRRNQIVFTVISIIILGFLIIYNSGITLTSAIFIVGSSVVIYYAYWYLIRYDYIKRVSYMILKSTGKSTAVRNIGVLACDDGFEVFSDMGSNKLKWSTIQGVDEDKKYIYIVVSDTNIIAIPRKAFDSNVWEEKFISMCQSHIASRGDRLRS